MNSLNNIASYIHGNRVVVLGIIGVFVVVIRFIQI